MHGVLKDEQVWSSSLREGASIAPKKTQASLLLDVSHNSLGDLAGDAIANALYHDKWVLGKSLKSVSLKMNQLLDLTFAFPQV